MMEDATESVFKGMPWWVKAVAFVGFPIIAALISMYINFAMLQPHVLDTVTTHERLGKQHDMTLDAVDSLAYTNFIMCQRSAVTREERSVCIRPPDWRRKLITKEGAP